MTMRAPTMMHIVGGAFGFVGVSVLAVFYVGVSVLEEKSIGISVLDMRCGDGKMDFFGRYFGNLSNSDGVFSRFKGSQIKVFEFVFQILHIEIYTKTEAYSVSWLF